ncbi:MAG TPA: hypothetical protein PLW88_00945 [Syntrophorhabdaceae bacterium]|nr:hypothetical protein [Syntrophorhabdaceae bacterium]HPP05905.1 hypothetical protein [Syntrophorhabdaceae bacterium]
MKVVIQKPDLDTCLTALILGISEKDEITTVEDKADEADINNPSVICIECGGTGLVELNNFDHHDPDRYFPPACIQAYESLNCSDVKLIRLVEYVSLVDDRPENTLHILFPSPSNIFSGMVLVEKDVKSSF